MQNKTTCDLCNKTQYEIKNTETRHSLAFFFAIKPTRCTNFTNLFWHETLHVSGSSSVHHQSLFTVHSAMVYVIQVFRQLSSRTRMVLVLVITKTCAVWIT